MIVISGLSYVLVCLFISTGLSWRDDALIDCKLILLLSKHSNLGIRIMLIFIDISLVLGIFNKLFFKKYNIYYTKLFGWKINNIILLYLHFLFLLKYLSAYMFSSYNILNK